ncbi:MAG: glycosyltransferase [Gemmataceae bacterium]|nr:glycosyltransferase [Gemmataceae bacterium]
MTLLALSLAGLGCAAAPALLCLWNRSYFRPPPRPAADAPAHRVSVLIPARNEEGSIGACVESVLASEGVELEVIVLDDHSTDRTAEVVREMAAKDRRVRVEPAPPLPDGWCGKQHACSALAKLARLPLLTFLDADVRLTPDALARMAAFRERTGAGLVSGFPRQETGTLLEKLVIPLINWLLMGYLPMVGVRRTNWPGFGVGCGQWFLTTREAYDAAGGHSTVRSSLHDGLTLPRAYRRAGFHTDICDATDLAVCRMYRSAAGVWNGLAKNAREGMAATGQIGFWTVVLLLGQVLPAPLLVAALAAGDMTAAAGAGSATVLSYLPRLFATRRFRASWLGAVLHPIGVLLLLAIQWYAVGRAAIGRPVGWKGRPHPARP